jgi:hypothetical protein
VRLLHRSYTAPFRSVPICMNRLLLFLPHLRDSLEPGRRGLVRSLLSGPRWVPASIFTIRGTLASRYDTSTFVICAGLFAVSYTIVTMPAGP